MSHFDPCTSREVWFVMHTNYIFIIALLFLLRLCENIFIRNHQNKLGPRIFVMYRDVCDLFLIVLGGVHTT